MPLIKMEHYLVLSDDMEATKRFYCDALGMSVGPRPPLRFPGYWLYVGDTPCIHVAEWSTYREHSQRTGLDVTARAQSTGAVDHIAFTASGYDEMLERLKRNGIAVRANEQPGGALRQLFVLDPSGVKIEINFRAQA
jgi:catechol 2,3-dioxygenase-like lactoylglutathione lyase family enzyme